MEGPGFRQTKRISLAEGIKLLKAASLEELQIRAVALRNQLHPKDFVTFVMDSNPNYTNQCDICCSFCAFSRKEGGYFKSVDEIMTHFEWAKKMGLTTVLLQGGINSKVTLPYLLAIVRAARDKYPEIHPHFFSAPEIAAAAKNSSITEKEALKALFEAGLRTLPGGGAEILSDSVRKQISPKKISVDEWLNIHETAHLIGFKSTATMMYGHIETVEDCLIHLEHIRSLQDRTHGFFSFIPWSYKPGNNALGKKVIQTASGESYLRLIAFSRLYLDNFPHIGASWFSEGQEIGMRALHYGADDFGGTVMEETVHASAGWVNQCNKEQMIEMIREAGFQARERNSFYEVIRSY